MAYFMNGLLECAYKIYNLLSRVEIGCEWLYILLIILRDRYKKSSRGRLCAVVIDLHMACHEWVETEQVTAVRLV